MVGRDSFDHETLNPKVSRPGNSAKIIGGRLAWGKLEFGSKTWLLSTPQARAGLCHSDDDLGGIWVIGSVVEDSIPLHVMYTKHVGFGMEIW